MHRARRATTSSRREETDATSSSIMENTLLHTPVAMSQGTTITTPQTAPQGRRGSKASQQPPFTHPHSGPSRSQHHRRHVKSSEVWPSEQGFPSLDGSPVKGGHSLRKRARVDYTQEHVDDEVVVPNSTSAARIKRRKPDSVNGSEDAPLKKSFVSPESSTASRRNPARKTAPKEQDNVKDTIEVGVSFTDLEEPELSRGCTPGGSSPSSLPTEASASKPNNASHDIGNPAVLNSSATHHDLANSSAADTDELPVDETKLGVHDPLALAYVANRPLSTTFGVTQGSVSDATLHRPIYSSDIQSPPPNASAKCLPKIDGEDADAANQLDIEQSMHTHDNVQPHAEDIQQSQASTQVNSVHDSVTTDIDNQQQDTESSQLVAPIAHHADGAIEHNQDNESRASQAASDDAPCDEETSTVEKQSSVGPFAAPTPEAPQSEALVAPQSDMGPDDHTPAPKRTIFDEMLGAEFMSTLSRADRADIRAGRVPDVVMRAIEEQLTPYVNHEFYQYPFDDVGVKPSGSQDGSQQENAVAGGEEGQDVALEVSAESSPVVDSAEPTALSSPAAEETAVAGSTMEEPQETGASIKFRYPKLRAHSVFQNILKYSVYLPTAELERVLTLVYEAMNTWEAEYKKRMRHCDTADAAKKRREKDAKAAQSEWRMYGLPNAEKSKLSDKGFRDAAYAEYERSQGEIKALSYGKEWYLDPNIIQQDPQDSQEGVCTRSRTARTRVQPPDQTTRSQYAGTKSSRHATVQAASSGEFPQTRRTVPNSSARHSPDGESQSQAKGRRLRTTSRSKPTAAPMDSGDSFEDKEDNAALEASVLQESPAATAKSGRRRSKKVAKFGQELEPALQQKSPSPNNETPTKGKQRAKKASNDAKEAKDENEQVPRKRHLLTLKIPKSKQGGEPTSAITDNGSSRPSTASSETTEAALEGLYSLRPNRQKRFRDEPDNESGAPPKKRVKSRAAPQPLKEEVAEARQDSPTDGESQSTATNRKVAKIKLVSKPPAARSAGAAAPAALLQSAPTAAAAAAADLADLPKDYKSMTKSEKMSASMKSRWANGNMAGAVEKRKATLAAKKAAQTTTDTKPGVPTPLKTKAKVVKKEAPQARPKHAEFIHEGIPGAGQPFSIK